jgi:uncharacterized RDD family membrane protein YckC
MKCPKCSYLGFETGDRCKNCGYDFSLLAFTPPAADPDLTIRTDAPEAPGPELWLDRLDRSMDEATRQRTPDHLEGVPEPEPVPPDAQADALPLFNPDDPDDIPLIALPAAPRAPLSVRRTPDGPPRLRAVPRVPRRIERAAPALDFREEIGDHVDEEVAAPADGPPPARREAPAAFRNDRVGGRRAAAALVDHAILFAIDLAVVYFTLRLAGLGNADVSLLPAAPILTFAALLKLGYFTAFTAVGGQTIGKMALGIRVVSDGPPIDSTRAVRRTLAVLLSLLPAGIGFLPAFFGADRRAFHDRLTQTRVVGLPSA